MRPVTPDYLEKGNWIFRSEVELNGTMEEVFSILLDDGAWNIWHPEISDVRWQTPPPFGVGAKRTVRFSNWLFMLLLFGSLILHEEFLIWDENKRLTFRFNKTNRPRFLGYLAGMEDFQLEYLPNGYCKLTRTVAVDPAFITSMLGCILKPVLNGIFERSAQRLVKQFASRNFPRVDSKV